MANPFIFTDCNLFEPGNCSEGWNKKLSALPHRIRVSLVGDRPLNFFYTLNLCLTKSSF